MKRLVFFLLFFSTAYSMEGGGAKTSQGISCECEYIVSIKCSSSKCGNYFRIFYQPASPAPEGKTWVISTNCPSCKYENKLDEASVLKTLKISSEE